MAIQFIVEDGTGKIDSTSYCTVAEYKQWLENKGEVTTETDSIIQARLNVGTEFIDGFNFLGTKADISNSLQFPRIGIKYYADNVIPIEVKKATMYAAENKDDLFAVNSGLRSISYGPVSKTFSGGVNASDKFQYITKVLKRLTITGSDIIRVN